MIQKGPDESTSPQADGVRLSGGAIASLTGVGLLVIFMLQNTESVRLDFLFWSFTWPLWLLIVASAVLGALVWFGLGCWAYRRRKGTPPGSSRLNRRSRRRYIPSDRRATRTGICRCR